MTPDHPDVPIIPGPAYEPPTAPLPTPAMPAPPAPPQVVYVYQQPPQSSGAVSGGIWSFVFQFWYVVAGVFVFMALCCLGVVLLGAVGSSH